MVLPNVLLMGAGAVSFIAGVPLALWAVGFTAPGVAAGSIAAKMMGTAAVANGGGVAAGSLVAVLQSAGTGLSVIANVALGAGGAGTGALLDYFRKSPKD
ncbi:interferon alpha-inducible protein 27-like protein 2A [Rhinoraja longicauda]